MRNTGSRTLSEVRLLIFDLDGTLIDSAADLAFSVNAMREHLGLGPLSQEVISSYVGQGVAMLVRRALRTEMPEEDIEEAVAFFLDYYRQHMLDHTAPYPGVREALKALEHREMAVLTNKPVNFSRQILTGLKMDSFFSFVYGGNSFNQKKPEPAGVYKLMQNTGISAARTMMIGDSDTDVQTGRNAGVWTCGVTYGIGSHTLRGAFPDLMLSDLRELPPLLNGRPREIEYGR